MPDLHQIPHLDEIAHHGEYHGVGKRVTETFADRYHHQNKVVPSLEDAIRLTGLRDGMTISFHHHFRNGDHIVNMVLDKLAEMGFHDLKLGSFVAFSHSRSAHPPHSERRYHAHRNVRYARRAGGGRLPRPDGLPGRVPLSRRARLCHPHG